MDILEAIEKYKASFGLEIGPEQAQLLERYYRLLQEHNEILHLVAPMTAEEFAIRHLLESLTMLKHFPVGIRFADVGSGGGLPAIPCIIVRDDLSAILIESKEKKAKFLHTVVEQCGLADRVEVVARQFSELKGPDVSHVSCRALDGFTDKLPKLLKWCGNSSFLFFSGPAFRDSLKTNQVDFREELMPFSEQRYLFYSE